MRSHRREPEPSRKTRRLLERDEPELLDAGDLRLGERKVADLTAALGEARLTAALAEGAKQELADAAARTLTLARRLESRAISDS